MEQAQKVNRLEQDLSDLSKQVTALEVLPSEIAEVTSEVAEVKRDIGMINKKIDKLNLAVFGNGAIPIDDPVYQDNNDKKAQEVHFD